MYIFFFNDTATTEIYTLSLHDALPIYICKSDHYKEYVAFEVLNRALARTLQNKEYQAMFGAKDRKSTRLNSSHANISYAVFCLKKKTSLLPRLFSSLITTHQSST